MISMMISMMMVLSITVWVSYASYGKILMHSTHMRISVLAFFYEEVFFFGGWGLYP